MCHANMNMFARFDGIPSISLHDVKETKRNGWMDDKQNIQREIISIELALALMF